MIIIAPQKAFAIDRYINNPDDTATHYVRAIVRNSVNRYIYGTFDMVDDGTGFFSYQWVTPNDTSGTGLQVTILVSVYDDPGYTTISDTYGTEVTDYIIKDLAGGRSFGVGGLSGLVNRGYKGWTREDWEQLKKILREVLNEFPFPVTTVDYDRIGEITKQEEICFDSVIEAINGGFVSNDKTKDLAELLDFISKLSQKIESVKLEVPPEFVDLAARLKDIENYRDDIHKFLEQIALNSRKDIGEVKKIVSKKYKADSMPVIEEKEPKETKKIRPQILKLLGI